MCPWCIRLCFPAASAVPSSSASLSLPALAAELALVGAEEDACVTMMWIVGAAACLLTVVHRMARALDGVGGCRRMSGACVRAWRRMRCMHVTTAGG